MSDTEFFEDSTDDVIDMHIILRITCICWMVIMSCIGTLIAWVTYVEASVK